MFKLFLFIPPDYDYNFPTLGTTVLSSFLKKKGFDVEQVDLNLRYRDYLSNCIYDTSLAKDVKKFLLKQGIKNFFSEKLKNRYYSDFLARDSDGIFPSLPYDNNSNSSFYFTERLLSSQYLWRYLEDERENTFLQFYKKENVLDFLEKEHIKLTGISVISPSQAIASLTLGLLIKKNLPYIHVSIGGQWPALYRQVFLKQREFFRCFDSITVSEGETSLYNLAKALEAGHDISQIPNLLLKDSSLNMNPNFEEDLNLLPCPDFDGLSLYDYDGSEDSKISLTYETSRGCYWSKCAYCVDLPLPKPSYRRKSPELVIRDIKQLKKKYKADYLLLSDPGLSPLQMLEISRQIVKEGIEIDWWCMARLDNGFNREVFKTAAKAGLKKINFGFESASDRICKLLDKGNKRSRSERVIRDCCDAGIEVDLQTILGLPNETFDDGLETVDFLVTNKKYISRVTFNNYYLTPANYIYQNPDRYGIKFEKDDSLPFRFFIPFTNVHGINQEEASFLQKLYYSLLNKDNIQQSIYDSQKNLCFGENVSNGCAEFCLNQESSKIYYLRNQSAEEYLPVDNKEKEILDLIKKGNNLKNIYLAFIKKYPGQETDSIFYNLITGTLKAGFLKEQ